MSDQSSNSGAMDLSYVHDAEVRRALRAIHQQFADSIARQQMEIEAVLELLLDKHIGSIGEFKRHLTKIQQNDARHVRIHEQIAGAAQPSVASRPAAH